MRAVPERMTAKTPAWGMPAAAAIFQNCFDGTELEGRSAVAGNSKQEQTVLWTVGLVLLVQGFGSVLTEALWRHSFGVSGVLIRYGAPLWTSWIIGAVGLGVCGWAVKAERANRP
ncbi:hypothetical protein [Nocardia sp. NPDC051570]|uniref:hypothetical protein n=1 Tax=Nocardia sp. NPDC051570 TaxID=3364324 RepID=UPI00378CDFE4